jgi:release factor glutamine methyltransferase
VAVAIAHERPAASVLATDISEAALAVARRNAARHNLTNRIRFVCADLLASVPGPFDLIVANPPYVRSGDRRGLQPEVREEPEVALYSGSEGLDAISRLIVQAPRRLRNGGSLIIEFGLGQEIAVEHLIGRSPALRLVDLRRDLQGIARTAIAKRAR